ncbi:JmjC domain-containing protein [Litoribrevibacter euphylliae]|uniref:JmjC domain-containing protein n=1 Tax=Litoribrevibacter euphylliae TaxID=1834034 RepID=A0ABV7HJ34_9GAMM
MALIFYMLQKHQEQYPHKDDTMNIFKNAGITTEQFLKEYWQKKPLFIPNAFEDFQPVLSADELAGLSCEENIESRLIFENGPNHPWELHNGPFNDDTFANLPAKGWTLLVQAVDQVIPEASHLLNDFNFIPNWRLDDLMISFAVPGGSVGPHYDQYDVFLIQAEGERIWQIGEPCTKETEFRTDTPLHILAEFDHTQEFHTKPGDILYIPPRVPHFGVAATPCQTYSVGFRAPSYGEIVEGFAGYIADKLSPDLRFTDSNSESLDNPGLISDATINQLQSIIQHAVQDKESIKEWFAGFMSQPKYEENNDEITFGISPEEMSAIIESSDTLYRNEQARFLYVQNDDSPALSLFVNGHPVNSESSSNELIMLLCQERCISIEKHNKLLLSKENIKIIKHLYEQDWLYVE